MTELQKAMQELAARLRFDPGLRDGAIIAHHIDMTFEVDSRDYRSLLRGKMLR